MKPLFDRVVLQLLENQEEMKGGIILPAVAQEKSQIAKVIEIGTGDLPDGKKVEMQVKKGLYPLFSLAFQLFSRLANHLFQFQ